MKKTTMPTKSFFLVCLLLLSYLESSSLSGCGPSGEDDDATTQATPNAQGDDDDDSSPQSNYAFYEDFERDAVALEHDYPYNYYDSNNAMSEAMDRYSIYGIVNSYGSTVFGLLIETICGDDNIGDSVDFEYTGEPIDLTHCTSGTVSFDWGFIMYTYTSYLYVDAEVAYRGMGEDNSTVREGQWNYEHSWQDSSESAFGPERVTYPLDYYCGYEAEGDFRIYLNLDMGTPAGCYEGQLSAGMVWIDNIAVELH